MTNHDVSPFTIAIPDEALEDLDQRLRRTRFPRDFANDDWRYGTNRAWLTDLVDYWHASADGWSVVAERVWPDCVTTIETHGNCLAAAAAMYGVAVEELTAEELDVRDPRYPVLVGIECRVP